MRQLESGSAGISKVTPDKKFPKSPANLESVIAEIPTSEKFDFISPYYAPAYDFPWNPDPLAAGNSYAIYDEMRHDEQIKVALSIKKDMVVNSGWQIVCESDDIAEFITDELKAMSTGEGTEATFEDVIRDILSSYDYGFSLSEPIFKIKEDGLYTLKTIKVRPPHSFRFNIDDFGNVLSITQAGARGDITIKPSNLIHHVYQQEFGNPFGKSDLRAAHESWKAKKFIKRFFNVYLERFAGPFVLGKYAPGMQEAEITAFYNALKSAQNSTFMAMPSDAEIELIQPTHDASDVYIRALDYYNLAIARAILVPDLLGIGGSKTEGGSFALGEKHFQLFMGIIKKDRDSLSRRITQNVIGPWVKANFGDIPCQFEFLPYSEENDQENITLWVNAINGKIFKPNPEEVDHFRKKVGFPPGPVEFPEPLPVLGAPGFGPKGAAAKEEKPKGEVKEEKMAMRRAQTSYEKKVDFGMAQKAFQSFEASALPKLNSAARQICNDLIDQIKTKGLIRNFQPEKLNSLEPRFLKDMNRVFRNEFSELFTKSINQARAELFPNGTKNFVEEGMLPEEFLAILEAESFKTVGDYSMEVTKRAKNLLVKGMKDGLSESELVKLIRDEMGEVSERWLGTVVRTKSTEIFNSARKVYWESDPIAKQMIEAYEFSALMDDRVSEVCASLDGKIFTKGEFVDKICPPLHFNCRSVLVPVTKFEEYKTNKPPSLESLREMGGGLILGD